MSTLHGQGVFMVTQDGRCHGPSALPDERSPGRKGPALVHAHVIRPYSHSLSDDEVHYRPPAERQSDAERDPLARFPRHLLQQGIASQPELDLIRNQLQMLMMAATWR